MNPSNTSRMTVRRGAALLTALIAMVGLAVATTAPPAFAAGCSTSTSLTYRNPPEPYGSPHTLIARPAERYVRPCGFAHQFWFYDDGTSAVDNPVTIIFVSNTTNVVGRIYAAVEAEGLDHSGDPMVLHGYGYPVLHTGTQAWTSTSHGRKNTPGDCWGQCAAGVDIHLRTYGPDGSAGTQTYQSSGTYRYYVPATTHLDINENTATSHFGYNDQARQMLIEHMVAIGKWTVVGKTNVSNSCYGWFDNSHYCDSDGYAALVLI